MQFFFFFDISYIHVFFSFNFCPLATILFSMPCLIFWALAHFICRRRLRDEITILLFGCVIVTVEIVISHPTMMDNFS